MKVGSEAPCALGKLEEQVFRETAVFLGEGFRAPPPLAFLVTSAPGDLQEPSSELLEIVGLAAGASPLSGRAIPSLGSVSL